MLVCTRLRRDEGCLGAREDGHQEELLARIELRQDLDSAGRREGQASGGEADTMSRSFVHGRVQLGADADLVLLDTQLQVQAILVGGTRAYRRQG
jgi:hypothetical protein